MDSVPGWGRSPGGGHGNPCSGRWSLNHWTAQEVPGTDFSAASSGLGNKASQQRARRNQGMRRGETAHRHRSLCCAKCSPQGPQLSPHMTTAHPVKKRCHFHCRDDGATKKDKWRDLELSVAASLQSQQCELTS